MGLQKEVSPGGDFYFRVDDCTARDANKTSDRIAATQPHADLSVYGAMNDKDKTSDENA